MHQHPVLVSSALVACLLAGCGDETDRGGDPAVPIVLPPGPEHPSAECGVPTGASYYLSPSGDDSADGSESAPWRSLAHGVSQLAAGDALYLGAGTYAEPLVIDRSGSETDPIIVAAVDPDDRPVIDGTAIAVDGGLVSIVGQSHVEVCNLTVRGSAEHGVMVTASDESAASAVTLRGLSVEHSAEAGIYFEGAEDGIVEACQTYFSVSSGIGIWYSARIAVRDNVVVNARYDEEEGHEESVSISGTSDFEVSGNEVYLEPGVPCTGGNAAIKAKEGSQRGRMFGNYVHDFFPEGHISLDAWDAGLGGTPTLNTVEIFANRIVSSGGIRISSEEDGIVEDVKIYNNLLLFTDNGIMVTAAGSEGPRRNIEIFNNTVYEGNDEWFNGITVMTSNVENVVIRNNLIVSEYGIGKILVSDAGVLDEVTVDHNLVWGPVGCYDDYPSCTDLSLVAENVAADPLLVDGMGGDCHLNVDSPAIDAGAAVDGLVDDFDGVARPAGSGIDIGAFEYVP